MSDHYVAYVGSYTRGESKGLHILDFCPETLEFKLREVFEINNPSFVHLSYDQKFLYCNCDEGVASFKILKDGSLVLINKANVNGLRPCYLSTDREKPFSCYSRLSRWQADGAAPARGWQYRRRDR